MALIDRLSSLLDDVICHILSFLPTKLSVATSILGKRWRFLWAHVPCLDFSEDDFTEEGTQASDIIHRVILQHKAKIMDTLRLRSINYNEYELETLMTTVINRGIQNLYLQLDFIIFPRCIFNCKTIVDLHLDFYRAPLSAVDNVSLPSLKKFLVYHVVCENDESLPRFLSGCPSLEELDMEFTFLGEEPFDYGYVGCINISSPTIKTLKLDLYNLTCPSDDSNPKYRMIINAPALTYLQLYGYYLECITVPITMISLVEADIRLQRYNTTVVKFLQCYVKCLVMSGWELEEFVHRGVACSTGKFDNLTELELLWNIKWSLLVKFLQIADNLEVLICQHVDFGKEDLCLEPEQVPKCLLSCLRTITIKWMPFNEHIFDMVRYLLRNSRVLERMEIFTPSHRYIDFETKFQALQRISLFERGSNACQLAFLSDC